MNDCHYTKDVFPYRTDQVYLLTRPSTNKITKTFAHDRTLQKFQCEVNGCVYDTVTKECCTLDNYQNTHCVKKDNCNLD
jgi:hypothetical protein